LWFGGCKNVDKVLEQSIFRYNEDAGILVLDPAFTRSQAENWVVSQVFNTLTELDSNLIPVPSLAKSWTIRDSGRTYVFHLQQKVKFHTHALWNSDQERVLKASDVAFSLRRLIDATRASPGAWLFHDKVNSATEWVRALDDTTLQLTLLEPYPQILSLLAMNFCMVVPETLVKRGLNLKTEPVGSGPFRFAFWEPEVRLVLLKHDQYWEQDAGGQPLPYLDAVNIDFIRNKQTAFMKFVSGEYDFFNGIEGSFKDELLTRDGQLAPRYRGRFQMLSSPFLNTEYLGFYLGSAAPAHPVSNVLVRKALSYAIDRNAMVRYLRNGIGDPGIHGFVPPVLLHGSVQGYTFDPQTAAAFLREAGFPGAAGLPELELNTTSDYADMALFIQQAWSQIGVRSRIAVHPGGQLRQLRNKGAIRLFRGSWIADYADAENYLACFTRNNFSPAGPNYTHYAKASCDALYSSFNQCNDSIRNHRMWQMDQELSDEAPVIVLYYDRSIRLMQNDIAGLGNNAMNQLSLKRVRKMKQ